MVIVCISDTHEKLIEDIPDGDILIHAGDFTISRNSINAAYALNDWFKTLPHKHKILVPGNHDWCFVDDEVFAREIFTEAIVLINEEIIIEGVKFYGTPDQPIFYNWAFNKTTEELVKSFDNIPEDTAVLITHTPPFGILDVSSHSNKHVGSGVLLNKVLEVKPKFHIFGHIHEGYGVLTDKETTYINASLLDDRYRQVNKAITIEV